MVNDMIVKGFYPAIYSQRNIPRYLYPAYVKTYLDRDVRDLLQIKDMWQFHIFIKICASRIGSLFNASEIANEIGVSSRTISAWLSVLQASYIIFLLPPYSENIGKRLIKTPKLYFIDTGLACSLLDIETPDQLSRDKMRGALFENFIISEALKQRYNAGKESNIYFYRDSNQTEIDLLLHSREGLFGIEIKSAMTYNEGFEKSLRKMKDLVKSPITGRAVVYTGTLEDTTGEIKILNYSHIGEILSKR